MVINTFFKKNNTLVENSLVNTAKNPVVELYYGRNESSRFIFSVDLKSIFDAFLLTEMKIQDTDDLKHVIRMFNTSFFDYTINDNTYLGYTRASSFDLVLYKLEESFDEGIGYDKNTIGLNAGKSVISESPSNYFNRTSTELWANKFAVDTTNFRYIKLHRNGEIDIDFKNPPSNEIIEYSKIIAMQHFDSGKENLEMDVSEHINTILISMYNAHLEGDQDMVNYIAETNNFCLAFEPSLETKGTVDLNYVGFFSKYANSAYSPFVQSENVHVINDNRTNFILGEINRLYFFHRKGKYMYNADEILKITLTLNPDSDDHLMVINPVEVYNPMEGVYYVEVNLEHLEISECDVIYDIWEFKLNDVEKSVEQSFSVKEYNESNHNITLFSSGIDRDERINRGDTRKVFVNPKIKYTSNQYDENVDIYYRIYAREGIREIPLVEYHKLNKIVDGKQYFGLYTLGFLPNTYFIDIKFVVNNEVTIKKEYFKFVIVDTYKLDRHEPNKNYVPNIKNQLNGGDGDDKYIIDITDEF